MSDFYRPLLLLVDADDSQRIALAELLSRAGYEVAAFESAAEARVVLEGERRPDLAVLDLGAPDVYESRLCAQLKERSRPRSTPVLGLQPPWLSVERLRTLSEGVDDLLPRPVAPEVLLAHCAALARLKQVTDGMSAELQRLTQVGIALSAEHNLHRLLERIVDEARALSHADAGTLYLVDPDERVLRFEIMQCASLGTRQGGASGEKIDLPPVPLNPANVSAYVALTGATVNIPDVYEAEGFDFSGPRKYDRLTGYRSRSMLVVPVRNHEDEVIGVLQLINAQKPGTREVVAFAAQNEERTLALASQAGVALTNARLINDLEALLEGLLQAMATAIDEKSHYTAGHVRRVTRLACLLAEAVNERPERVEGRTFSADELNELRIAGLLHDLGKLVIPEHVVDKATKLQTVYDRIDEIRARFSVIRRGLELEALRRKLELVQGGAPPERLEALDRDLAARLEELAGDLAFLESANVGGEFMTPERLARIEAIGSRTYLDDAGAEQRYLSQDEVRNLSIARGTLLPEELDRIREHAAISVRLLAPIPFSRRLRNVPVYAGDHHETLDGSGYPGGKWAEELPLQSRILAIADIYDALTAADRPYKKAFPIERAHAILRDEAARGRLDGRLVELFIEADVPGRMLCPHPPELPPALEVPEAGAAGAAPAL
ncbi:MAG: HD domain-containing phosphohydrolase [Armatimonadota bacterium]